MKIKTLKAGTIIQMHGIPMALVSAIKVKTSSGNWEVISSSPAEMGRKGGMQTSEAKAAAAKANGVKGGRPRKQPKSTDAPQPANDKDQAQPGNHNQPSKI